MEKRYIMIILVMIFLAVAVFFYLTVPSDVITSFLESDNTVQNTEDTTEQQENNNIVIQNQTSQVSEGEEGGGGGGGMGGTGEPENYTIEKINYTLSVDSQPEGLEILVNYSLNSSYSTIRQYGPYSVLAESGTQACVLLTTTVKGGSVVTWEIDGQECNPSLCAGFMGCNFIMTGNHTAVVYYSTPD